MAYEFNIEGEVIPYNHYGTPGFVNAKDVEDHLIAANGEPIKVNINSYGGDTDEGKVIYTLLREYRDKHNVDVTTRARGRCDSIATVIFLAGDKRILNRYIEPFVHNPWAYSDDGDAKHFTRIAADLTRTTQSIAKFYADHTDLTYEDALLLMDKGSYISVEEALKLRFGTEIDNISRPVALNKILNKVKTNNNKMDNTLLKRIASALGIKTGAENSTVFTDANEELEFASVAEGESPKVGDSATIGGEAAEGEYTLPDGTVYVFTAGELTEIRTAEVEEVEEETDAEKIERLESELSALKSKSSTKVKESSQNSTVKDSEFIKLQTELAETKTKLNNLTSVITKAVVSDKSNQTKHNNSTNTEEKKGLAGGISKLKSKRSN